MTSSNSRLTTSTAPCWRFREACDGCIVVSHLVEDGVAKSDRGGEHLALMVVVERPDRDAQQVVLTRIELAVGLGRAHQQCYSDADDLRPIGDDIGRRVLIDARVGANRVESVEHFEALDTVGDLLRSATADLAPQPSAIPV